MTYVVISVALLIGFNIAFLLVLVMMTKCGSFLKFSLLRLGKQRFEAEFRGIEPSGFLTYQARYAVTGPAGAKEVTGRLVSLLHRFGLPFDGLKPGDTTVIYADLKNPSGMIISKEMRRHGEREANILATVLTLVLVAGVIGSVLQRKGHNIGLYDMLDFGGRLAVCSMSKPCDVPDLAKRYRAETCGRAPSRPDCELYFEQQTKAAQWSAPE